MYGYTRMGGVFLTNVPRHCYIGLSGNCQVSFVSTDYFSHESERLGVDSNYSRFHLSEHFAELANASICTNQCCF